MSHESRPAGQSKKRKNEVPVARNIVALILLIIFATIGVLEFMANRNYNAAIEKLNPKITGVDIGPTQKEVEDLIGQKPDGQSVKNGQDLQVKYTWRGVFRQYTINARYTTTENPARLVAIE